MRFASVLLAVGCLLSAASGQWVEKTIGLPDSLPGLSNAGPMLYNPWNNLLFVAGTNGLSLMDGLSGRVVGRTVMSSFEPGSACYASQANKVYWAHPYVSSVRVFEGASGRLLTSLGVGEPQSICYNPVVNMVYISGVMNVRVFSAANDSMRRYLSTDEDVRSLCSNARDNRVYAALPVARRVGVIECSSDSIRRYIDVGIPSRRLVYNRVRNKLYCYATYPSDSFAVVDCEAESVVRLGRASANTLVASYSPVADRFYCAGANGLDVFSGSADTLVAHIDGSFGSQCAVDSVDNRVWFVSSSTGQELVAVDGAGDTVCARVALADNISALCYNPNHNKLYGTDDHVTIFDPEAGREEMRVLLNFTPCALCHARTQSKLYCAGLNEASVAVVSTQSNKVLRLIPVGRAPSEMVYDRPLALVSCLNYSDSTVSFISGSADSVVGVVAVGAFPRQPCLDTVLHKLWCGVEGGVAVVDLAGRSLDTVVPMARPAALLADPVRSRVYCSVPSEGRVFVLDAAGDSVIDSILVGGDAGALCLLPDSGLLCCATPSSNSIAVIDCAINRVVKIVPAGDGDVLFYNSRRNKLYCASSGYQGRVAVISCSTWTLDTTLTLQTGVRALDYDPVADRLYCLPSSGSWVSVIECRRDIVVSQVLAGEYPAAIAFASAQRRMYVANQYGSSLTVIKDTAHAGVEEDAGSGIEGRTPQVTVVSGVLVLAQAPSRKPQAASWLLDISGRKVLDLAPGPNDVRALPPGVYFVRVAQAQAQAQAQAVRKVVITR